MREEAENSHPSEIVCDVFTATANDGACIALTARASITLSYASSYRFAKRSHMSRRVTKSSYHPSDLNLLWV